MTAPSLLDELEGVVRLMGDATPGLLQPEFVEAYNVRAAHGGIFAQIHNLKGRHGMGGRVDGNEAANNARLIASAINFLRAHHAELADMANELRVARESFKRCDEICKCTAEGWRTAEEDMAKRLEAAEMDARATKRSAETLCRIYFEIAAEAVGEDKVRAERDRRIHAAQEGEG